MFRILTLLAGLLLPVTAFACPEAAAPQVIVKLDAADPVIDRSLDSEGIAALINKTNAPGLKHNGVTYGSTGFQTAAAIDIRNVNGKRCAYVESVEVTIQKPVMRVFINNEYAEDSCQFRVIHEHEMEHVEIYHDLRAEDVSLFDGIDLPNRDMSSLANDDEAFNAALHAMNEAVRVRMSDYTASVYARQYAKDTEEEYRRISGLCEKW